MLVGAVGDHTTKLSASVTKPVIAGKNTLAGLVTYTDPLIFYDQDVLFFSHDDFGINMNQDFAPSGVPEQVYNGSGTGDWTPSSIAGTWDFVSTDQVLTGNTSIDGTSTVNNDRFLLTDTDVSIGMGDYAGLHGHIYITSWSSEGTKEIEVQARLSGVDIGGAANLTDFITTGTTNEWQDFFIEKSFLGLSNEHINEVTFRTIDNGPGSPPNFYFDEMFWLAKGANGPTTFTIVPEVGEQSFISETVIFISHDVSSVEIADPTTFAGLSELTNGISLISRTNGITRFATPISTISDLIQIPSAFVEVGGGITNSWIQVRSKFDPPLEFKDVKQQFISLTVSDDLSSLLRMRMSARRLTERER